MSGGSYDGGVYNNPQYQFTQTAAFVKQRALADQGCDAYGAGLIANPVRLPGWNQTYWGGSVYGPNSGAYGGPLNYGPQAPWGGCCPGAGYGPAIPVYTRW